MSTSAAPPNPCLLAILLVAQARTGSGAQVVFHYPPNPSSQDRADLQQQETDVAVDGQSSSSDSDGSSSSEDNDFEVFARRARTNARTVYNNHSHLTDEDEDYRDKEGATHADGRWRPSWDPLLGLGEDGLVSLLSPGRAWHKRRFEMSINDLTFLGRPVYARADGSWQRRKQRKSRGQHIDDLDPPSDTASDSAHDNTSKGESASVSTPPKKSKNVAAATKSSLTMFNVVFVMDPPPLEQAFRVKEMYDNVVKKFSKVLKYAQVQSDYVAQQAEMMQNIKSSHLSRKSTTTAYYNETREQSSLATALVTIYKAISQSRIAAVALTPKVSTSLQIPPTTSTSYLPSLNDPPIQPGLWLTTATESPNTTSELDTASAAGALQLAKNYTLLLKANPHKILKDIQAEGGPMAPLLTNYIEKGKPTKSFYKIAVASHISRADIQQLARHLIYWRRAIAIPPLHQRDTYIVSPNADMSKLIEATKTFEATFPMMPSLPKFLNLLSGTPVPFGSLIPSTDHKEEYYRVLASLMRGGWVTQLRTFAYVRVDPAVKKAVRQADRDERLLQTRSQLDQMTLEEKVAAGQGQHTAATKRPSMVSHPSSDGRQSIDPGRLSSTSSSTSNPKMASLIMSPLRASAEESKWLAYISESLVTESSTTTTTSDHDVDDDHDLSDSERVELKKYWPILVKYFNGAEALEKIPVREGLKRHFVWDLLGKMGVQFDRSSLDEKSGKKGVLLTVRHW